MNEFCLQSYDYALPKELIATYPASPKESAKLLIYKRQSKSITHSSFYYLLDFIPKDSTLVLNDTQVIKARLYGHRQSGGKNEILFHHFLANSASTAHCVCQIKNKAPLGTQIVLDRHYNAKVVSILEHSHKEVIFFKHATPLSRQEVLEMFELIGHTPLPPYIKRTDESLDSVQYQSIFAKNLGSIAAPTASLHFSHDLYEALKSHFEICYVTLHIGAGTFFNVESNDIREHKMHTEFVHISKPNLALLQSAKKLLCVGTTALRSVEFLARNTDLIHPKNNDFSAQCDLFLYPSNPPIKADFLLTNFHFPKSSLIMLVASMVGLSECHRIYQEAIKHSYRFFSYGDGMLIL